jgi:hypothetical protein
MTEKTHENFRIAIVPAEIRNEHVSATSPHSYYLAKTLSGTSFILQDNDYISIVTSSSPSSSFGKDSSVHHKSRLAVSE